MQDIRNNFLIRCGEVRKYFQFLCKIEEDFKNHIDSSLRYINQHSLSILRANAYLLLYNLIEATARNILKGIYNHLTQHNVSYHDLNDTFKIQILKNMQSFLVNENQKTFSQNSRNIAQDAISMTFNVKKNFNGNVDKKAIQDSFEEIGITLTRHKRSHDGRDLFPIKDQRNALAHGEISFEECGRSLTANDLKKTATRTISYLIFLIKTVEQYLTERQYVA